VEFLSKGGNQRTATAKNPTYGEVEENQTGIYWFTQITGTPCKDCQEVHWVQTVIYGKNQKGG
jgi:hypothetical protein